MKVYVVREIYGPVFAIFDSREKAEAYQDRLYSEYSEMAKENDWLDTEGDDDWIVEEWEVE